MLVDPRRVGASLTPQGLHNLPGKKIPGEEVSPIFLFPPQFSSSRRPLLLPPQFSEKKDGRYLWKEESKSTTPRSCHGPCSCSSNTVVSIVHLPTGCLGYISGKYHMEYLCKWFCQFWLCLIFITARLILNNQNWDNFWTQMPQQPTSCGGVKQY